MRARDGAPETLHVRTQGVALYAGTLGVLGRNGFYTQEKILNIWSARLGRFAIVRRPALTAPKALHMARQPPCGTHRRPDLAGWRGLRNPKVMELFNKTMIAFSTVASFIASCSAARSFRRLSRSKVALHSDAGLWSKTYRH